VLGTQEKPDSASDHSCSPEECNDRVVTSMVNRAEGVKFVYAWRVFAVFVSVTQAWEI